MAWHIDKMKPETIERRRKQREIEQKNRRACLVARLKAKVEEYGQDSIYAEMLSETLNPEGERDD